MKRVCLDTNVYISALVFGGKPRVVLQVVELAGVQIVAWGELQAEIGEVLVEKFGWSLERVEGACSLLWEGAVWVEPEALSGITRDAADHHVLGAALAAGAEWIVTGDADLLSLRAFRGIGILTPAGFLEQLREGFGSSGKA